MKVKMHIMLIALLVLLLILLMVMVNTMIKTVKKLTKLDIIKIVQTFVKKKMENTTVKLVLNVLKKNTKMNVNQLQKKEVSFHMQELLLV